MESSQNFQLEQQASPVFRMLPKKWIILTMDVFNRIAEFFIRLKISPNVLTIGGTLAGLAAGAFFYAGKPLWAGLFIVLCGFCDILDGKVAVNSNRKSLYGAIFDSSMDRYSEFFIYLGLAFHFRTHWGFWAVFFAFLGSMMVSYTRARAEGLGFDCKVGIMQRAERMILLTTGAVLGAILGRFDTVMAVILLLIAVFSNFTAVQRILHVRKAEIRKNRDKEV